MLWDYVCPSDHVEEHWTTDREWQPLCKECTQIMHRVPGGVGMLFYEEGRARTELGLSNKPITSYKERNKLLRAIGGDEMNGTPTANMMRNPKSVAMKEYLSKDKKGRWI